MKDGVTLFARREFFGGRGKRLLILWGCISSASICSIDLHVNSRRRVARISDPSPVSHAHGAVGNSS